MDQLTGKTGCSNHRRVGRAHCEWCRFKKLMLCSDVSDSAIKNALKAASQYRYPSNTLIYEAGSPHKYIYFIRLGMVKLEYSAPNGENRIVRLLGPGSSLGLELLDGANFYNHNAVTISQVDLCRISKEIIEHIEPILPHLCRRIRELLQSQLKLADQWVFALGTGKAKQRVAHLILILYRNFSDSNGAFVLIHRNDMAAMISITTETISRTIAEFKRKKILFKIEGNLYHCDVSAMEKIANPI